MSENVLCAWLGRTDIRAAEEDPEVGSGPIAEALEIGGYDVLVLLSNYSREESEFYRSWAAERFPGLEVPLHPVVLSSPTEFAEIYEHATAVLDELTAARPNARLTFHLSPGTPAMAATWILIASGKYSARLIETSVQAGVRRVELPFEILAEYHPRTPRKIDEQVLGMSDEMLPDSPAFDEIIHTSGEMHQTVNQARRIALFDVPALLLGASGTGKELFARAIHNASARADGPFVSVNCGALPEGLVESELFGYVKGAFTGAAGDKSGYIEEAHGGTLFLDEIGELPLAVQVLLLRVLQEGSFQRVGSTRRRHSDFRLVSATNRPLADDASRGRFRDDLFHRIAVGVIKLPPLRHRGRDLQLLTDFYLQRLNRQFSEVEGWQEKSLSVAARKVLQEHSWPGNVRELINTLTRACLWSSSSEIDGPLIENCLVRPREEERVKDRPLGGDFRLEDVLSEVARHYLSRAMEEAGGSKTRAAELLGMSNYQTLGNWLKRYGLED
jgi:transcriptional regulator with PAS, ATPase and Fis domain